MFDYKQFVGDACNLYYKYRDEHSDEDWEQMYFDDMESRYTTDDQECLVHLFYADDENIGEVAQGILDDLVGKNLLHATCFDDKYRDTTVAVMIVKKD